jgi:flagellar biosynthesis anti-sigma factor FlgM
MKISNPTQNYINQTYTSNKNTASSAQAPKADKTAGETTGDSLNISPKTRDLQKISSAMDNEPIDRTKLVADLKQQVQTNQYNFNAEQVAEKMIGSLTYELG